MLREALGSCAQAAVVLQQGEAYCQTPGSTQAYPVMKALHETSTVVTLWAEAFCEFRPRVPLATLGSCAQAEEQHAAEPSPAQAS